MTKACWKAALPATLATAMALTITLAVACSDDDGKPAGEAGVADQSTVTDAVTVSDGPIGNDVTMPWPDGPAKTDTKVWSCTPGEANMCEGYKNQHCKDGLCTPCPDNYVDCDRQGDCECLGACDGLKCVTSGGKP